MKFTARLRNTEPNGAVIDPTKFVCIGHSRQAVVDWARLVLSSAQSTAYVEISELREEIVSVLTRRQVVTVNEDGEENVTYETVETTLGTPSAAGRSGGAVEATAREPESGNGSVVGDGQRSR